MAWSDTRTSDFSPHRKRHFIVNIYFNNDYIHKVGSSRHFITYTLYKLSFLSDQEHTVKKRLVALDIQNAHRLRWECRALKDFPEQMLQFHACRYHL